MKCEECDRPADWRAVSPRGTVHACSIHLGTLLDDTLVWFVHPTNQAEQVVEWVER